MFGHEFAMQNFKHESFVCAIISGYLVLNHLD
jgi:hypothetical protein